jgi:chromosome segregation ATPase
MQREQIEALHRRVAELEAALELRWADIAHLDTKLADVLDRAERAEAALSAHKENVPENEEGQCAEWPRCACGRGGPDLCAALSAKEGRK